MLIKIKIGIITVFNSPNCVSILQAFALKKYLENNKFQVAFLDIKARNPIKICFMTGLKYFIRFKMDVAFFYFRQMYIFYKEKFATIQLRQENEQDLFILGSDEIWNLSRKEMNQFPLFWGYGLSIPYIAYAPSINICDSTIIQSFNFVKTSLDNISALSVRDSHSCKELSKLTDKTISIVCDPTLLLEYDEWKRYENTECPYSEFILLYIGINLSPTAIQNIKLFATKRNKKLISILSYFSWCDRNIAVNPLSFLSFFAKADYVITSTFHGSIFSLIYKKEFASFTGFNIKVCEILYQVNLQSRIIDMSANNIEHIFENTIDQNNLQSQINELRRFSQTWLLNNINIYSRKK
jgi:hypothetical protein